MYELLLDGAIILAIEYFDISQFGAEKGHMMEDTLSFLAADALYLYLLKGVVLPSFPNVGSAYWTQLLAKVLLVGGGDWLVHKMVEGRPNIKKSLIKSASVTAIDAAVEKVYPMIKQTTSQPGARS